MDNKTLPIISVVLGVALYLAYDRRVTVQEAADAPVENQWSNWETPNSPTPTPPPIKKKPVDREMITYQRALAISKSNGRPVFVFFHTDQCTWCSQMKINTFTDDSVKNTLNSYVVCYVDTSKDRDVARKYSVRGIPSYYIIDSNEKIKKSGNGYKNPDEFIKWLKGKKRSNNNFIG